MRKITPLHIVGLTFLICLPASGPAQPVMKRLQENFYHVAEKTDSGPTVHTALNFYEDTGVYANSSAVFVENGFTHDFSTGYSGSFSRLAYGLSYDATQYNFDSLQEYYDQINLYSRFKALEFNYTQDDLHAEAETSLSTHLFNWQLSAGSGRYQSLEDHGYSYRFNRLRLNRYWQNLFVEARLQEQGDYHTQSYYLKQRINDIFSNQARLQVLDKEHVLNLEHLVELKTIRIAVQLSQQWQDEVAAQRIHRLSLRKAFQHVDLQLDLNDSQPGLGGSRIMLHYERVIHY